MNIFISGIGAISSIGGDVTQNFFSLWNKKHGLSHLTFLDTLHGNQFLFGEIKKNSTQLLDIVGLPLKQGFTRTSLLGIHAAKEAILHAQLHQSISTYRVGLINATTVGGMCDVEKIYFDIIKLTNNNPEFTDTIDCADCTQRIADYFGINYFLTTISTACSSSANAIMLGARMIQNDLLDIAICGGTDSLTRFTINGFNALKNMDKEPCKPFCENRNGLNLGEGAAYLILESEKIINKRRITPVAQLSGYSNFNEAFHPTAPNPTGEGAFQAMQQAIALAQISPQNIQYINAHGTATIANDESEGNAIKRLFKTTPYFSSTKCYTGHTLAAAGALEAVYSILCLQNQCILPQLNFTTPMKETLLFPETNFLVNKNVQHVLTNSLGFGGNNSSLVFSKV